MFNIDRHLDEAFKQVDKALDQVDKFFESDAFTITKTAATSLLSFQGTFPSFPPVNIFAFRQTTNAEKNTDGPLNQFVVELALSGYKSENVDVNVETVSDSNYLVIESKGVKDRVGSDVKWYQRGIAGRAFKMKFVIASNVTITSASLKDGLLSIYLTVDTAKPEPVVKKVPVSG